MSKNSKKQTRRTSSVATPAIASPVTGRSAEREFSPDYSYVIKDLKRIGILAGTFFVVLVALSFILK
jgi:hypothetical protein